MNVVCRNVVHKNLVYGNVANRNVVYTIFVFISSQFWTFQIDLLRGTLVNKTYGKHKNFIFTYFYQHYLVLFTMVPRSRKYLFS